MTKPIRDTTTALWPGFSAPSFKAPVVFSGGFTSEVDLQSLRGSYCLLIFYPMDFCYISPTELMVLDDNLEDFKQENCGVLAISTSSILSKTAFLSTDKEQGGVAGISFGLVVDKEGEIGSKYGVLREGSGYTYRAMVLLDKEGIIIFRSVSDLPVGLGISEALRILKQANGHETISMASSEAENAVKPDAKANSMAKNEKRESDETTRGDGDAVNELNSAKMINKEIKSKNNETGEKTRNSDDEVNPKSHINGEKPNTKNDKCTGGRAGDVGPEMCDCDLGYSHTVNLHEHSTLEKRE